MNKTLNSSLFKMINNLFTIYLLLCMYVFLTEESNDNTNMIAVSLPNESEEENTPKKEVTHHLPPGAYPVYPQFMGMLN